MAYPVLDVQIRMAYPTVPSTDVAPSYVLLEYRIKTATGWGIWRQAQEFNAPV